MIRTIEVTEHFEYFIHNFLNTSSRSINFVDNYKGSNFLLKSFSEDKFSLGHGTLGGTYYETHTINHVHDSLNLSSEVLMAWSVDNVDVMVFISNAGAFGTV